MDAKLLSRYLHVKALSERGTTDSERATAASILAGLEAKYPGIREAAEAHARKQPEQDAGPGFGGFEGFPGGFPFGGDLFGGKVSPDDVLRAFSTLRDLFSSEDGDEDGDDETLAELQEVAGRADVAVRQSRKGDTSIHVRFNPDDINEAADLIGTPDHAASFAAFIGARVAETLRETLVDALFTDEDGDEDEDED